MSKYDHRFIFKPNKDKLKAYDISEKLIIDYSLLPLII